MGFMPLHMAGLMILGHHNYFAINLQSVLPNSIACFTKYPDHTFERKA